MWTGTVEVGNLAGSSFARQRRVHFYISGVGVGGDVMSPATNRPMGAAAQIRRIRERAAAEGWSLLRLVDEVRSCCNASLLAAHRLARGWTLQDAVNALADLRSPTGGRQTTLTVQMLNAWERDRV